MHRLLLSLGLLAVPALVSAQATPWPRAWSGAGAMTMAPVEPGGPVMLTCTLSGVTVTFRQMAPVTGTFAGLLECLGPSRTPVVKLPLSLPITTGTVSGHTLVFDVGDPDGDIDARVAGARTGPATLDAFIALRVETGEGGIPIALQGRLRFQAAR